MKSVERLTYTKTDNEREMGHRAVRWTVRDPEDRSINEVALVVPGILAMRRLYNPFAREVAGQGLAVATMAHEGASPLCVAEVNMVARSLSDEYQLPVRLIGHSLGGIHATKAALEQPDDISGLLLMQPAGYGGVHPLQAIRSLSTGRPDNSNIAREFRVVCEAVDYAVSSRLELASAALMASRHSVIDTARDLPEHIGRDALLSTDDPVIRSHECKIGLARAGFRWDEFDPSLRTGHNAVMYHATETAKRTVAIIREDVVFERAS